MSEQIILKVSITNTSIAIHKKKKKTYDIIFLFGGLNTDIYRISFSANVNPFLHMRKNKPGQ